MKVRDIMTRNVLTLEPECPILEAMNIFARRIRFRHLPVVKNGRLRGLLTPFDLLGTDREETRSATVACIMKTNIRTIAPDAEAVEAGQLMLAEGLGCLPVADGDGRLMGIITGSDFLRIAVTCMQAKQAVHSAAENSNDLHSGR